MCPLGCQGGVRREGCPTSCAQASPEKTRKYGTCSINVPILRGSPHPQRVPRLPWCSTPRLRSVLHAHTRVHPSLARARYPIVCIRLSRRASAAPPALPALLYQSLQLASPAAAPAPTAALIACASVPPGSSKLPVTQHQPAGPAAARPARAAQGGRRWALASGWEAPAGGHTRLAHAAGGKGRLICLYSRDARRILIALSKEDQPMRRVVVQTWVSLIILSSIAFLGCRSHSADEVRTSRASLPSRIHPTSRLVASMTSSSLHIATSV